MPLNACMPEYRRALSIFLLFLSFPSCLSAASITVFADGVMGTAELYDIDSDEYIPADALGKVISAAFEWDAKLWRGRFTSAGRKVVVIPDNPFVSIDGSLLSIPITPQFRGGRLLIPILAVPIIFREVSGKEIRWDAKMRVLTIGQSSVNITGIRLSSSDDETRVVLELSSSLKYTTKQVSEDKFEIFFEKGVLVSGDISKQAPEGHVSSVHGVNVNDGARVAINLSKKNLQARTLTLDNPDRLLVTFGIGKKKVSDEKYSLEVVIIDAGHGGKDPGAMGPTGLQEKVVTLDIAKRVAELVTKNLGVKAILTRSEDEFVSLKERADIANKNEAELFISIHCNASTNRARGGIETYFLSEAKTDWARAVEARENAVIRFELPEGAKDSASLEYILWDMAQKEFLSESSKLAELVHEELAERFSVEDRGLKQANFYVLRGCYMPAILVEVGFLSNRKEEKLLRKKSSRQKAAEGIFEGIKEFKKIYERKLNL